MIEPPRNPGDAPQVDSPPPVDSTIDLRRRLLAACERLEWEWREHGTCQLEPILADFPPSQQGLIRATLEELAAELRAEAEPAPPSPAGGAAERFPIRRTLATGGMGLVSEAFDREFRRTVALKEILPSGADNPEYRHRFLNEAEITGRLEHPGIIPVYSRGTHPDGRPFYAMRLIAGEQSGTLQQALRQFHDAPPSDPADRDLQWRGLLRRVIDVCHTMAYAHSQGVLHRDLKPANILLGPHGETLVVDWGLARDLRSQPHSASPDGTPSARSESTADTPGPNSPSSSTPRPVPETNSDSSAERSAGAGKITAVSVPALNREGAGASVTSAVSRPHPLDNASLGDSHSDSSHSDSSHSSSSHRPVDRSSTFPGQAVSVPATRGLGTPGYASPEQLLGEPDCLRPTSDIYSLGTLLYAVLTGVSPFPSREANDPAALLHKICTADFPPPRQLRPAVDPGLEAICLKAMARQPAARYPSATALAADLERHLAGEAVSAWREPWLVRVRRGLLRHRTLVATLGVALTLTTLAASTVAVLQTRNRHALAQEAVKLDDALRLAKAEKVHANQERERAVAGETLAVQAVDEFGQAVLSHPELTRSPELLSLRKELLGKPIEFYRQLRERLLALPEPSIETLWKLRDATAWLALLQAQAGDPAEAIRLQESVLELADRALASPGVNTSEFRRPWGKARVVAHLAIGSTLATSADKQRELREYELALVAVEPLRREAPEDRELRSQQALAHSGAAAVLALLGRSSEAKTHFEQAAELHRENIQLDPADVQSRRNLARSQHNFAMLLDRQQKLTAADEVRQEAEALFESVGDNQPTSPQYRDRQAAAQFNRGLRLSQKGQINEALQAYRQSSTEWRRLGEQFPGNNEFAHGLLSCLKNMATLLQQRQQIPECLEVLQELVGLLRTASETSPDVRDHRAQLVEKLHLLGHLLIPVDRGDEARELYTEALAAAQHLMTEVPADRRWPREVVELNLHLAAFEQEAGASATARERLEATRPLALSLVESPKVGVVDRVLLRSLLLSLAEVQDSQGDSAAAHDSRQSSLEWDRRDPAQVALDHRVDEVLAGGEPKSTAERVLLARRAATRGELKLALQLCSEALEADPRLLEDRNQQVGLFAAGVALEVARSLPVEKADEATELRRRAEGWLWGDLEAWRRVGPDLRGARRSGLKRWASNAQLFSISKSEQRASLPVAEQERWQALWDEATRLASEPPAPR